jgi:hypothetical protein
MVTCSRERGSGVETTQAQEQLPCKPVLQPAHIVAYLLDPMFAVADGGDMVAPEVSMEREKLACELIRRVGGAVAGNQFMS